MITEDRPNVLFIDDNTEELSSLSQQCEVRGGSSKVLSPADVAASDLKRADLVVVDYSLNTWIDGVTVAEISCRPLNGIALVAVLREHAKAKNHPPTGFALITGKIDSVGPLPEERRPHIVSRLNNVEWFFEKGRETEVPAVDKMMSLANAIRSLPESVSQHLSTVESLLQYLCVSKSDLWQRYRDAVERCRPPIHHLAERSHGLVVVRWLLHRVLPYTTFLLDTFHLAARLGVTPESMKTELAAESGLVRLLSPFRYLGPLLDFDGPRWWRDGVEQLLWDITEGNSAQPESVLRALTEHNCIGLEATPIVRPVATLDHTLKREQEFSSRDDVILLQLDEWPSYAEPAYARKETLTEHPDMQMYVVDSVSERDMGAA